MDSTMEENLPQKVEEQLPEKKDDKPKRFVEKGRDVVFDSKTRVYWLKKDSWQDKGKFFNWHEAVTFADNKNLRKIGGFDDWRLPNIDEATSLYDENCETPGKGDANLHIDPIFPEGCLIIQSSNLYFSLQLKFLRLKSSMNRLNISFLLQFYFF